jgi:hypothetical protein
MTIAGAASIIRAVSIARAAIATAGTMLVAWAASHVVTMSVAIAFTIAWASGITETIAMIAVAVSGIPLIPVIALTSAMAIARIASGWFRADNQWRDEYGRNQQRLDVAIHLRSPESW